MPPGVCASGASFLPRYISLAQKRRKVPEMRIFRWAPDRLSLQQGKMENRATKKIPYLVSYSVALHSQLHIGSGAGNWSECCRKRPALPPWSADGHCGDRLPGGGEHGLGGRRRDDGEGGPPRPRRFQILTVQQDHVQLGKVAESRHPVHSESCVAE